MTALVLGCLVGVRGDAQRAPGGQPAGAKLSVSGVRVFNAASARGTLMFGDSVVAWFDRDDAAVYRVRVGVAGEARAGRQGRGPMEFTRLSTLMRWSGDSMAVIDFDLHRITVLSSSTLAGRSFQLSTVPELGSEPIAGVLKGRYLLTTQLRNNTQVGPPGAFQPTGWKRVIEMTSGRELGRLATTGAWSIRASTANSQSLAMSPNTNSPLSANSTNRFAVTNVNRDTLLIADSTGRVQHALALAIPRVVVSRTEQARQRADWLAKLQASPPALLRQFERYGVVPDTRSRVMGMWLTDSTTWLVLEHPEAARDGNLLVELDDVGAIRRCQPVDAGWRVLAVGTRAMLTTRFSPEEEEDYDVFVKEIAPRCPARRLSALVR